MAERSGQDLGIFSNSSGVGLKPKHRASLAHLSEQIAELDRADIPPGVAGDADVLGGNTDQEALSRIDRHIPAKSS